MVNNFLTFDIEEWYHANYDSVSTGQYKNISTNLESNIDRIIDLCDTYNAKSTCFVLGELADRKPQIVQKLHQSGHEIASHSYAHRLVYTMTPSEFKEDLKKSCDTLEQITGEKILGFRAPSWSVKKENLEWFYEILAEQGLLYSSSVYPAHTYLYGIPGFLQTPHFPVIQEKQMEILEIPQSVTGLGMKQVGFAGGFYLRLFPKWFIKMMIHSKNKHKQPVFIYLHPREIDKHQPKLILKGFEKIIHYHGIDTCEQKLEYLLDNFSSTFVRMDNYALAIKKEVRIYDTILRTTKE